MTYNIRKTNGTELIIGGLPEEIVDTEAISGIGLIGRLTANYGETQSNNFVHLVENFANDEFPENPLVGQICYKLLDNNSNKGSLYVCVSNSNDEKKWKKLPLVLISNDEPDGNFITGDMWYDTDDHSFNMYDDELKKWIIIGPSDYNNIIEGISDNKTIIENILNYGEDNAFFITLNIVGKKSNDKCCAWRVQLLVRSYNENNSSFVKLIGNPDYELIATNDEDMVIEVNVDENNNLILNTNEDSNEEWIVKYNIVKV